MCNQFCVSVSLIVFNFTSYVNTVNSQKINPLDFKIVLDTVMTGYTDTTSWFGPCAGVIPGEPSTIVLTIQKWLTGRSDVFTPVISMYSIDNGKTWTAPEDKGKAFEYRKEPDDVNVGICNFTPKWHNLSKTLLGTAHTVRYRDKTLVVGLRSTIWSAYNPQTNEWAKWQSLKMPNDSIFYDSGACADQRVDLPNGDILMPIYFRAKGVKQYTTTVAKCSFDGEDLKYKEHGSELNLNIGRGLFEPSLTYYKGKYYLTIRNDENGYFSVSDDGLHFGPVKIWHFDDGREVGTYNTQQHWVTHSGGLFLVYTRKGANNDNVMRHRAPLFIAQVDTKRMVLLRNTERVLMPNNGARLGNFGVANINEKESWITAAELMTGNGEEKYGAKGRVWNARILWNTPNANWKQ